MRLIDFATLARPGWKFDWHHRLTFDLLERCALEPDFPSVLVSMPPGSAKTETVAIIFPAWCIAHDPLKEKIISLSNAANLSQMACTNVQRILLQPQVAEHFPLEFDKCTQTEFTIVGSDGRPAMYAVPLGGSVTGARARILIYDDLVKSLEVALSEVQLSSINAEFSAVAETRILPGGKIVGIGTRWSLKDVHEQLLQRARNGGRPFIFLNLAATNDSGEASWLYDSRTNEHQYFEPYKALAKIPGQPYSFTRADYDGKRADLGNALFETLYQGNPTSQLDALFPADGWTMLEEGFNTDDIAFVITSWDTSTGKSSDYSANVTILVMNDGSVRVDDVWTGKPQFADLMGIIMHRYSMISQRYHHVPLLVIEDSSSGTQALQLLQTQAPDVPVYVAKAVKSKVIRAQGVTPLTRSGRVGVPKNAPWRQSFISHMAQFPVGRNDDVCDAFTHACKALLTKDEFHRVDNWQRTPGRLLSAEEQERALRREMEQEYLDGVAFGISVIDSELDEVDRG
ncbi:MAG: phage terminase large subunit [Acidobacteriia bacterium]|nr:phage terminase large subunit [Terriglobia bacterium]